MIMTSKFLAATVSGLAALATASGAFAQAGPAAAAPAVTHGAADRRRLHLLEPTRRRRPRRSARPSTRA
jgi:hypothetical protein